MRWLGIMLALGALCPAHLPAAADVNALARVLLDPARDAAAKGEVCQQLMELGPAAAPAVPALIALLRSKEEVLRDYAATTLGRIGPAAGAALPALRHAAAHDESTDIRGLAQEAIDRIGAGAPAPSAGMPAQLLAKGALRGAYFQGATRSHDGIRAGEGSRNRPDLRDAPGSLGCSRRRLPQPPSTNEAPPVHRAGGMSHATHLLP